MHRSISLSPNPVVKPFHSAPESPDPSLPTPSSLLRSISPNPPDGGGHSRRRRAGIAVQGRRGGARAGVPAESEATRGRRPQPGREEEASRAGARPAKLLQPFSDWGSSPTQGARIDKPCGPIPISQSLGCKSV